MSYMEISNLEKSFDKNEVLKNISLTIEQPVGMRKVHAFTLSLRPGDH